jgi:Glycosyltransferase family 87
MAVRTSGEQQPLERPSLRARFTGPHAVRAIRDGLSIGGVLFLVLTMLSGGAGYDFFAYWSVNPADPYTIKEGFGAFHYAPPLVWLVGPLKLVPWPAAYWLWFGLLFLVLVWLARDWALAWLAFPPVVLELYHGNIHLLIAAALVLMLRRPPAFMFLALSKVSPGIVALWWLVRREWRPLAIALGASAAVIALSFALAPALWWEYLTHISSEANHAPNLIPIPLALRLPFAAAIAVLAARLDRPWLLAPATVLALPLLWIHGFAALVAITPLVRMERAARVRSLE